MRLLRLTGFLLGVYLFWIARAVARVPVSGLAVVWLAAPLAALAAGLARPATRAGAAALLGYPTLLVLPGGAPPPAEDAWLAALALLGYVAGVARLLDRAEAPATPARPVPASGWLPSRLPIAVTAAAALAGGALLAAAVAPSTAADLAARFPGRAAQARATLTAVATLIAAGAIAVYFAPPLGAHPQGRRTSSGALGAQLRRSSAGDPGDDRFPAGALASAAIVAIGAGSALWLLRR